MLMLVSIHFFLVRHNNSNEEDEDDDDEANEALQQNLGSICGALAEFVQEKKRAFKRELAEQRKAATPRVLSRAQTPRIGGSHSGPGGPLEQQMEPLVLHGQQDPNQDQNHDQNWYPEYTEEEWNKYYEDHPEEFVDTWSPEEWEQYNREQQEQQAQEQGQGGENWNHSEESGHGQQGVAEAMAPAAAVNYNKFNQVENHQTPVMIQHQQQQQQQTPVMIQQHHQQTPVQIQHRQQTPVMIQHHNQNLSRHPSQNQMEQDVEGHGQPTIDQIEQEVEFLHPEKWQTQVQSHTQNQTPAPAAVSRSGSASKKKERWADIPIEDELLYDRETELVDVRDNIEPQDLNLKANDVVMAEDLSVMGDQDSIGGADSVQGAAAHDSHINDISTSQDLTQTLTQTVSKSQTGTSELRATDVVINTGNDDLNASIGMGGYHVEDSIYQSHMIANAAANQVLLDTTTNSDPPGQGSGSHSQRMSNQKTIGDRGTPTPMRGIQESSEGVPQMGALDSEESARSRAPSEVMDGISLRQISTPPLSKPPAPPEEQDSDQEGDQAEENFANNDRRSPANRLVTDDVATPAAPPPLPFDTVLLLFLLPLFSLGLLFLHFFPLSFRHHRVREDFHCGGTRRASTCCCFRCTFRFTLCFRFRRGFELGQEIGPKFFLKNNWE